MNNTLKVLILFLALCTVLGFAIYFSYNSECDLESLVLKDNMMPLKWERLWRVLPPALPKDGAQDALNVVYEKKNDVAQHTIYRYRNGFISYLFLRINDQVFFPSGLINWINLAGSEGWGLNGDEQRVRCGESDDPLIGYRCSAVVRYGPFISDFSSPIGEGIMSLDEFKGIVIAIDGQISSCIKQPENQR